MTTTLDDTGRIVLDKRVQLKPYQARPFHAYELMTDEEIVNGVGGTLVADTENYNNYFLIAFKDYATKKIILLETPFNPRKLAYIMQSYRTIWFNGNKYDIPLVWLSYYNQDLTTLKDASNWLVRENFNKGAFEQEYNIKIFPTQTVDLIEVCPLRGSLKLYGGRLHAKRIQDIPFNPYGELTPEEIDIVRDYCINDLNTTELLLDNLKEQLQLREQMSREYNQDLMSKSDAQIAEAVISSELKRLSGKWPKQPDIAEYKFKFQVPSNMFFQTAYMQSILEKVANTEFSLDDAGRLERTSDIKNLKIQIGSSVYRMGIGGLHSSEECISWKSNEEYQIYDRDVASYYPAIVLNCQLYPQHLGEDFLKVYKSLVDRRIEAKKAKNIAVSENLKVTINGTFGKTGSPYSVIYAPQMTIQITVGGQLYLLMLIEAMELNGIQVISANTDGIVMYVHKDKVDRYLNLVAQWEQITGFTTEETKYEAIYSRDVNAYMAIKSKDEVKGKNVYYDPWRGKTAKDQYWRFQKNPNAQICIEAVEKLITQNIPIEQTIRECKDFTKFVSVRNVKGGAHKDGYYLGKTVRWYYSIKEFGTINYITNNNRVPDTEYACPAMDLPNQFPDDIRYSWYIEKAKTMLEDLAYSQKQKQLRFF